MLGQTEPDLHPKLSLSQARSAVTPQFAETSAGHCFGVRRQTGCPPRSGLREAEAEGSWQMYQEECLGRKVCSRQGEGIQVGIDHVQPGDQRWCLDTLGVQPPMNPLETDSNTAQLLCVPLCCAPLQMAYSSHGCRW